MGIYHLLKDIKDPEREEKLKEHLVNVHLLCNELRDDAAALASEAIDNQVR